MNSKPESGLTPRSRPRRSVAPVAAAVGFFALAFLVESAAGLWLGVGYGLLVAALGALVVFFASTARQRAAESAAARRELTACRALIECHASERAALEARCKEQSVEFERLNQELQSEIAERKRTEEILRTSEQRSRELFDNANDLIYVHDLDGNFVSINHAVQRITGYNSAEALKMNVAQLLGPEGKHMVRTLVARKLGGEGRICHEMSILTQDGRWLTLEACTRLVYENGVPIGIEGVARDVTERKRLEEELLQSQKMEAIGRFAGGVAHDFNNLLTVIGAYSQMIGDALPENELLHGYTQEILLAAQRAGSLTNRLLAFSRRQVFNPRVLELNSLILAVENMLRRLIGEDIELRIELEPGLGPIQADPTHLEQVIMNLAVNARDAMISGGVLTLRTASCELGDDLSENRPSLPAGRYVTLEVVDTGVGMDAEVLSHLFEPFFTTKEPGKGTGLGLSTVYGIVKQCAGGILVHSEPGKGAKFTLYFPRVARGASPAPEQGPSAAARGPNHETVLLVEDEPGVRKLVREMLRQQGYRVLEASSGDEALSLCENGANSPDLLLSDVVMPNMSGCELAKRLRSSQPGLKVLYMTGYTEESVFEHGSLGSGTSLLKKPFLSERLARTIREVLDT